MNIQGDEPWSSRYDRDAIAPLLEDDSIICSNLMAPIESEEDYEDPNEVKVVVDRRSDALLFLLVNPFRQRRKGRRTLWHTSRYASSPSEDFLSPTPGCRRLRLRSLSRWTCSGF